MKVKLLRENNKEVAYQLLNVIEFDSARKRMSVIVRTPDNRIMIVCKGADSIIEQRLRPGQKILGDTKNFLDEYAKDGLRTLLIAYKYVDMDFYEEWSKKYQSALVLTKNKEKTINILAEEIELNFELVGSTAIEDCLQDEVGKTIEDIKSIGIKVWVLTGDKVETAINIGYSCKLLNDEMNTFILREKKSKKILEDIAKCYSQ